jgi:hypothetical protein
MRATPFVLEVGRQLGSITSIILLVVPLHLFARLLSLSLSCGICPPFPRRLGFVLAIPQLSSTLATQHQLDQRRLLHSLLHVPERHLLLVQSRFHERRLRIRVFVILLELESGEMRRWGVVSTAKGSAGEVCNS